MALLVLPISPAVVSAQDAVPTEVYLVNPIGGKVSTETDQKKVKADAKGVTEFPVLLGGIIQTALGIIGSLTLLAFVVGGFLWLTSAGSPERVKKGKDIMVWATIGVFIIFSAYAILRTVMKALGLTGVI